MKLDSTQALISRKRKKPKKKETFTLQPTISKKRPRYTKGPKVKKHEFAHNLVEIRPSRIPGAGLGVFAKATIPESTKLGEYKGKIITEEEYDRLGDHQCEYIFEVERRKKNKVKRFYVDARFKKHSNWTRYVNGAKSKEQQEDVNIGSYQYGGRLFYRTNKDVQPGEELLVDYGSDYWTDEEEDSEDESDRDSVEEESSEESPEIKMDVPKFQAGEFIRVINPFTSDGVDKRPLNKHDIYIIQSVDDDGWLSINQNGDSWPENTWICPENFLNIEIVSTTNDDLESKMQEEDDSVNIYKSFSVLSLELKEV